jgi:hypothetical protein
MSKEHEDLQDLKTMVVGKNKEHAHAFITPYPSSLPPNHPHTNTHTHTTETVQYTDMFKL